MRLQKRVGRQTVKLTDPPKIISTFSIVGPKEGNGPLKDYFDEILNDDTCGKDSYEKAESQMMFKAIKSSMEKANLEIDDIENLECEIR